MLKALVSSDVSRWTRSVKRIAATRGGPDAVHRLRVLSRRCREGLRLLHCPNKALARFGRSLSPARDVEMLCQLLTVTRHPLPERQRLRRILDSRRQSMRQRLAQQLRSHTVLRLDKLLQQQMQEQSIVHRDNQKLAHQALRKAYHRLHKLWKKRPKHPDAAYLHPLRRAIRRLRYVSELTTPIGGRRLKRLAKRTEEWQRQLGDYHDALIAQKLLGSFRQKEARDLVQEFQKMEKETAHRFWKKWQHGGWHKLQHQTLRVLESLK